MKTPAKKLNESAWKQNLKTRVPSIHFTKQEIPDSY